MLNHAILSPSGATRWLACTPSARLETKFPDSAGNAANEGTLAHKLGELLIKQKLKIISKLKYNIDFKDIAKHSLYNKAMFQFMDDYATYVIEQFAEAQKHTKDAQIFLEETVDLTNYVPEGFGTRDVSIVSDDGLHLIDLKYGKGVPVSAVNNKQLMLYALGTLDEFDQLYNIRKVRLTIYQPRLDSITDFEISVDNLRKWANEELIPKAKLAFNGEGDYVAGPHCLFCRAKATCRANSEYNLQVLEHDFKNVDLLKDNEIADIIGKAANIKAWLTGVEEYALQEALRGKKWPGYKLVHGRSNRAYSNEEEVIKKLIELGYTESDYYNKKIIGIGDMESLLTKPIFKEELSDLITKPPGKPTLVELSDKREEYNSAANDFANVNFSNI